MLIIINDNLVHYFMEMVQEYIFLLPFQNNCGKMMMIMMIESIFIFYLILFYLGFRNLNHSFLVDTKKKKKTNEEDRFRIYDI